MPFLTFSYGCRFYFDCGNVVIIWHRFYWLIVFYLFLFHFIYTFTRQLFLIIFYFRKYFMCHPKLKFRNYKEAHGWRSIFWIIFLQFFSVWRHIAVEMNHAYAYSMFVCVWTLLSYAYCIVHYVLISVYCVLHNCLFLSFALLIFPFFFV